ncbi:TOBE domain-containing protein [Hydrogenimonas sp.]
MNEIPARIERIETREGVSRILFDASGRKLAMVGLEPPAGAAVGAEVLLGVKATHLILAKSACEGLGLFNRLPVTVSEIEIGEILGSVTLAWGETILEAILPAATAHDLGLQPGLALEALFLESELSILEIAP